MHGADYPIISPRNPFQFLRPVLNNHEASWRGRGGRLRRRADNQEPLGIGRRIVRAVSVWPEQRGRVEQLHRWAGRPGVTGLHRHAHERGGRITSGGFVAHVRQVPGRSGPNSDDLHRWLRFASDRCSGRETDGRAPEGRWRHYLALYRRSTTPRSIQSSTFGGKCVGEDLQGDVAIEPCIARAIHLPHSAGAKGGQHFVHADLRAGRQGHDEAARRDFSRAGRMAISVRPDRPRDRRSVSSCTNASPRTCRRR
jgi:hypothetical protein